MIPSCHQLSKFLIDSASLTVSLPFQRPLGNCCLVAVSFYDTIIDNSVKGGNCGLIFLE